MSLDRGMASALRALGFGIAAAALLVGGGFAYVAGTVGLVVGLGLSVSGVIAGALLSRAGRRRLQAADDEERRRRELEILRLAEDRGAVLRVTDVSRHFGLSAGEAEAMLASMADGSRVTIEVTHDGLIEYAFRELEATSGQRVRVDLDPREGPSVEPRGNEAVTAPSRGQGRSGRGGA